MRKVIFPPLISCSLEIGGFVRTRSLIIDQKEPCLKEGEIKGVNGASANTRSHSLLRSQNQCQIGFDLGQQLCLR